MRERTHEPVSAANFRVRIGRQEVGVCFVSAISSVETGGVSGYAPILLRRALDGTDHLRRWRHAVATGANDRRTVTVDILDAPAGRPIERVVLYRARPTRWSGPTLDALSDAVAMEELEIEFERAGWPYDDKER